MEYLYKRLPKDLVYIIEEYAKDRTNYNRVIDQFQLQTDLHQDYWIIEFAYNYRLFWASNILYRNYNRNFIHVSYGCSNKFSTK